MIEARLSPEDLRLHKGISFVGVTTSFICHDGNGKVFMAKRSKNCRDEQGNWDFGGGGLKWGQTAEENVRREIKEEYNADAIELEFIGYDDIFRHLEDGTPTHWLALRFIAKVDPTQVKINEPDMADDGGWYELKDLPTPLHSQIPHVLKKYEKELRQRINPNTVNL